MISMHSSIRLPRLANGTPHQFVVLRPRTRPDPESDAVPDQRGQRAGLLGHQGRRADRQFEHEEIELEPFGHGAQRRGEQERLDERLAVQKLPVASGVYG